MAKIIILYTDAGGGHKSIAQTLQEIIFANTDWQVELINPYRELCANFDIVKRLFGISAEDLYNRYVSEKNSAIIKLLIISAFFKLNLALPRSKIVRKLTATWQKLQPDMVISVTPFINEIVSDSISSLPTQIPFVTLITDYQECCRNIWITKKAQKLVCCSKQLVQRALRIGLQAQNIYKLSGMLVAGRFYNIKQNDRVSICNKLNLQPNIPIAVVAFGSHGSEDMLTIAKHMRKCPYMIQFVFICGYDSKLQNTLKAMSLDYPVIATDFVDNVEEYMRIADVFIGKPGGLSVSEAALMHVPMILKYNLFTLIHERHNAKWVLENNIGITVKNLKNIKDSIKYILDNHTIFEKNFSKINNRAYVEILPILEEILSIKSHKLQKKPLPASALG